MLKIQNKVRQNNIKNGHNTDIDPPYTISSKKIFSDVFLIF